MEQGLGQHIGFGMLSATAEDVPRANNSNVVTTILRTVLFMFSPVVEWIPLSGKA
jgi:hypothetical protein